MMLVTKLRKSHFQFTCNFYSTKTPFIDFPNCIALLQSCAKTQQLAEGRKTHSLMLKFGHLNSPPSFTSLINMYSKCNSISDALSVFYESSLVLNVFVYNSILAGLTMNDLLADAFEIYHEMRVLGEVVPDKFTFPCVIKACPDVTELKNIHGLLLKYRLVFDSFIASALVHCYLKFQLIYEAVQVFEGLPLRDDIVLWNAMINGFVQIGEIHKSLEVFRSMADFEVKANEFTVSGVLSAIAIAGEIYNGRLIHAFAVKTGYEAGIAVSNALIDMYGKSRQLEDAMVVLNNMVEKDMYSWNSIVVVHEQCGDYDGTLKLLKRMMISGFEPDLVTIGATFPACSHLSALMHGKEIHGYMIRKRLDKAGNTHTDNAILDMYAKCGSMRAACTIFDEMKIKDIASWNIMVMGYGMHGFGNEALDLFYRMCEKGLKPDAISFIGILSACSHAGFISQGRKLLAEMRPIYSLTPAIEHYACVIDMLGRSGRLDDAFELVSSMSVKPNQVVWRTLLSACQLHGNADLAKIALQQVLEIDPEHCGSYVLMSNLYGAGERYDEVAELRRSMRQNDVKKSPGCSWIELNNVMHVFFTGDWMHPAEDTVYEGLNSLTGCLYEQGSTPELFESSF